MPSKRMAAGGRSGTALCGVYVINLVIRVGPPQVHARGGNGRLPAGFLYTGYQTGRSHLAELYTRNTELAHISLGASGDGAAVVHPDAGRVLGQALQLLINLVGTFALLGELFGLQTQCCFTLGIFLNEACALYFARFH